ACPIQRRGESAITDLDGLVAQQLAVDHRDRGDRVRALVHVRTEHDHDPRPFHHAESGRPGGQGLLEGGATLLSSHAGPSPTGHENWTAWKATCGSSVQTGPGTINETTHSAAGAAEKALW